jgi:hypothetical protein
LGGTFDRIRARSSTAALSGCHDSQTQAGRCSSPAAPTATSWTLFRTTPRRLLGWRRIDAANASPATSFMFHSSRATRDKLLDERMPLKRGKLDDF